MSYNSIFAKPWWLDIVAPNTWGEVKVEKGGQLFARLPYIIKKRYGFTLLTMAPLTQTLGAWISPYSGKYANKLSYEKELMEELIKQLPSFDYFRQNFHHTITNWLPFYWGGFQQTTRYTYVLEDLTNLDEIWRGTKENIRREIRKAEEKVKVRTDLTIDDFLNLNEMTFRRQGKALPYKRDLVTQLDQACSTNQCRKIFFAEDAQNRLHAAIYLIWDEQAAYYLMGGSDPALRNSGATSLLLWQAIQFAATVTKTFDFEGSMIEPIERFFRAFGAQQKPYFVISKANSAPLKMALDVHATWSLLRDK